MSDKSKIEWTDTTWNPVRGCDKISPGCKNCYAETFAERWRGVPGHPYEQGFDVRLVPEKLDEPLTWSKPRRVFVNSMSDLFHERVPFDFIDSVFARMALTRKHTFQVLTKRPQRMREWFYHVCPDSGWETARRVGYIMAKRGMAWVKEGHSVRGASRLGPDCSVEPWPLPNVWLGVSAENQRFADERLPLLIDTPAFLRFVSCEPLLGPIDLDPYFARWDSDTTHTPGLSWVIVGGESGPGSRPLDLNWVFSMVRQTIEAEWPIFVKQLGTCWARLNGFAKEDPKGADMARWFESLRRREFPSFDLAVECQDCGRPMTPTPSGYWVCLPCNSKLVKAATRG